MWKHRTKEQDTQTRRSSLLRRRGLIVRGLLKDEGGATAIEFAIVGLVLIYFIVGIVEFSMAVTVGNSLEAATNLSSRLGKTGYVDDGATQKQTIIAEVDRRVGPLIDMAKLEVTHEEYNDFESLTSPDILVDLDGDGEYNSPGEWTDIDGDGFKDGGNGLGTSGNIVIYRISYPWKLMTPLIGQFVGTDGIINLSAYSVVKNEPY